MTLEIEAIKNTTYEFIIKQMLYLRRRQIHNKTHIHTNHYFIHPKEKRKFQQVISTYEKYNYIF